MKYGVVKLLNKQKSNETPSFRTSLSIKKGPGFDLSSPVCLKNKRKTVNF
jgi:hypothetical protein